MAIAQEAAIWSAEEQETSILLIGIETVAATMYKHKHNITRYVHLKTELPFGTAILPYGCIWSQHATGVLTHLCLLKYSWSIRSRTSLEIHRQVNIYTMVFLSMKKKNEIVTGGKMDATGNCYTISTVHHEEKGQKEAPVGSWTAKSFIIPTTKSEPLTHQRPQTRTQGALFFLADPSRGFTRVYKHIKPASIWAKLQL